MSQNDFVIADANAANTKTDLNAAYQALASQNSGATAPATTYANMIWYDTATNILKMRNEADSAWLNMAYIDQTDGQEIIDDTKVVNTSGTQTGVIGDQTTGTWETGTGTTESLVSPAKIKAAIAALTLAAKYESAETAIPAAATAASVSHGLGAVPSSWSVVMRCKTTDAGYAVGDEIVVTTTNGDTGQQITAFSNATTLGIIRAATALAVANKSTGVQTIITNASWKYVFRAFL